MPLHHAITAALRGLIWALSATTLIMITLPSPLPWGWIYLSSVVLSAALARLLGRHPLAWALGSLCLPLWVPLWLSLRPARASTALSASDTCWYTMEREHNPMVVVGLMFLAHAPDPGVLESLIRERLLRFPRFRQVPRKRGPHLHWIDDADFDLHRHVRHEWLESPTQEAFHARVNVLTAQKIDFDHPLWQIHVIGNHPDGAAVVIRVHHTVADGIALVRVLLSLTDGPGFALPGPTRVKPRPPMARLTAALRDGKELLEAIPRMLMMPDSNTSLKRPLSGERRTAWSMPLPLDDIKRQAHRHDGKINDLVLAATAGALRRYFSGRGEAVDGMTFRVLVPINLRRLDGPIELGNKVGFIYLPLPVGEADRVNRLREVKRAMDRVKSGKEAVLSYLSLCLIGTLPAALQHWLTDVFNRNASSTMTNVPGPREALALAGETITNMSFFGPQSGEMGVGISLFSYRGTVTLGVNADSGLMPEPERLTRCFEEEIADWLADDAVTK